jgi:hypothetical protein
MINKGKLFGVELRRQIPFSDRHAHPVGEALTEGPGGDLHARRKVVFRMAGCMTLPLSKALQFLHRQLVAREVKQGIE